MGDTSRTPQNPAQVVRLVETPERAIGLRIADPLNQRLDALVEQVARLGIRTTRKEVVSALILNAPEDPEHLRNLLVNLKSATVGDYLIPAGKGLRVAEPRIRPGPRPLQVRSGWGSGAHE